MAGVLEGVRVLDLGRYIAGPLCGALLADLGAEVIRIERVGGGEDRAQYPLSDEADAGAAFLAFNRNKKSLTLNPGSDRGREVMRKLVATADIVLVNMPLAAIEKLGLDYESLKQVKPDIILLHTSAFGNDGPYAQRVGFDGIGQVMSGATYLSGNLGDPMKHVVCWVDCSTAMFNAYGALAAILHKRATGEGQKVETNLLRSALNLSNVQIIEQAVIQKNRQATGNTMQAGGPGDLHKTKNGWILIQVAGNNLFRRWARLMGEEDRWTSDPRFATEELRAENNAVLSARTAEFTQDLTTAEALAAFAEAKVPAGPLLSPQQVLEDEHVNAVNMYKYVDYPGLPALAPLVEPGARFSAFETQRNRPPTAGEHTNEILTELGYNADDIELMRADGTV
jgi:crotonobetainyl-CoA:carnitine CoA-transferase CaiB-like acyl-CoA transferase